MAQAEAGWHHNVTCRGPEAGLNWRTRKDPQRERLEKWQELDQKDPSGHGRSWTFSQGR